MTLCWTAVSINLIFEGWKQFVVDETDQFAARDLRLFLAFSIGLVSGPVAPTVTLGYRRLVGGVVVFPLLFALVEYFEEEHPGELAQTLGVAVHAVILTHDVLDGFDGTAEIHRIALNSHGLTGESGLSLFSLVVELLFKLLYGLGELLDAAKDAATDLGFATELVKRW